MEETENSSGRRAITVTAITLLFVFSFMFFLFLTFPYEVLKESLSSELAKNLGYSVQIGELGPRLPLGLKAKDVSIKPPQAKTALNIPQVNINVSIFPLLLGHLSINADLFAKGKGELDLAATLGLFGLIKGEMAVTSGEVVADEFPVDDFVTFALSAAASGPDANPMLAPIITALGFAGKMNGQANLKFNSSDPTQSGGLVDLKFNNAVLKLSDPALGLSDQKFNKALVKASLNNGALVVDPTSGFVSDELSVTMGGSVALKNQFATSQLDMKLGIKLDKEMREKFGWILDGAGGGTPRNGELTWQLRGPVGKPIFTAM